MENWDAWDGTKSKPKSLIQTQIEEYRHRLSSELKAPPTDVEPDIEPDIFIDMEPEYKKTKRVQYKEILDVCKRCNLNVIKLFRYY